MYLYILYIANIKKEIVINMKILMCIDSLSKDGASRVFTNLAEYLSVKNKVFFCCTVSNIIEYPIPKKVTIVHTYSEATNKLLRNIERLKNLNRVIKNYKPDIILSFLPRSSYMNCFLKRKRIKLVISVRNDPKIEYSKFFDNILMNLLYPKADGFVFQTEEAKEYFCKSIQKKSKIILNSVNPIFLEDELNEIEKKKEIVSVGRLVEQKNHKMLIDAFLKIHNEIPDYILNIYGDGPLRNELEKYIADKKIENKIFLKGNVDNIKKILNESRLFVLSSNYEGLPNSLIEAMAIGLPCVSTDCPCGGPRMLIENGINGFLVEVGNADALSKAIITLIKDSKVANDIGINAKKIRKIINPKVINKEWENYLKEIINTK